MDRYCRHVICIDTHPYDLVGGDMVIWWLYESSVVIRLDTWLYANRRGYTFQTAFQPLAGSLTLARSPKMANIGITTPECSPNARNSTVDTLYA